jgi:hypothetical protein
MTGVAENAPSDIVNETIRLNQYQGDGLQYVRVGARAAGL